MIIQHPMLWCAVFLMAGIAVGLFFPLPYYLPLLAVLLIGCTLLRHKGHLHDILTLFVWLLLGCSRASICSFFSEKPAWQQAMEQEAKAVQTSLVTRLEQSGISTQTLALAEALVVGKKDDLSLGTKRAYRKVGASHLLALSGMHLGIIYGILYLIFVRWLRHSRWRWYALPLVLLSLWGYALVAGMPVSLVRAALMLSIMTVISLAQHHTAPLHPLALSAIIILLIDPSDLLSISFQLSFTAVFFLLALWTPLSESFPKLHWSVELIAVSCVASLGTMPLVAYYFHQVTLIGPLLSLVLIPLTTAIIYLTLAAMLLPMVPLGWLLDQLVSLQQHILELAGSLPFATLDDVRPNGTQVALIYGALLVAIIRLRTRDD